MLSCWGGFAGGRLHRAEHMGMMMPRVSACWSHPKAFWRSYQGSWWRLLVAGLPWHSTQLLLPNPILHVPTSDILPMMPNCPFLSIQKDPSTTEGAALPFAAAGHPGLIFLQPFLG